MLEKRQRAHTLRSLRLGVAAVAALAAVAAVAASRPPADGAVKTGAAGSAAAQRRLAWIVSAEDLVLLRRSNAGLARRFFDNARTVVVGDAAGLAQVPERYDARRALLYSSLGAFSRDVKGAAIPQGVNTAFYDPESWPQTPAAERRDPVQSMQRFALLARQGGLTAIVAPGRDLALAQEGSCRKQPRETLDAAYLRCGFTGGARGASAFVVQAAPDELDLSALERLLRGARSQLASRSARTSVYATLSMAPPSAKEKVWPAALVRAATIELKYVDGIMLNFTPSTTWLAASFLRDLERMKTIGGVAVPG